MTSNNRVLLVACDFSIAAHAALKQAIDFASHTGGSLLLVHVERSEWRSWTSSGMAKRHALDRLTSWADRVKAQGVDVHVKVLKDRDVAVAIAGLALAERVDLIVVGEPSARTGKFLSRHSTTERLIRLSEQAVWVVRRGQEVLPRLVLCGYDGADESVEALLFAKEFARDLAAGLSVVHLLEHPEFTALGMTFSEEENAYERYKRESMEKTVRALEKYGVPRSTVAVLWGSGPDGLLHAVEDGTGDLVVVGRGRSSDLKRLISNTVAAKLLYEAPTGVIFIGEGRLRRAQEQGWRRHDPFGIAGV